MECLTCHETFDRCLSRTETETTEYWGIIMKDEGKVPICPLCYSDDIYDPTGEYNGLYDQPDNSIYEEN